MKLEYIDINELKPYLNNAKIHTAEQVEQIKKSIEDFGMNDPIAIDQNNEIIEGHGRLLALRELGYEQVPIIRLEHLTEEQKKAYTLVHNKLTMNTGFDIEVLQEELESILDFNMQDFGFDDINESLESFFEDGEDIEQPISEEVYETHVIQVVCLTQSQFKNIKTYIEKQNLDWQEVES